MDISFTPEISGFCAKGTQRYYVRHNGVGYTTYIVRVEKYDDDI
jgi:hypothetical protein